MFYLSLFFISIGISTKALLGQRAGQYSQPLFGLSFGEELQFPSSAGSQVGITNREKGRYGFFIAVELNLGRKSNLLQQKLHLFPCLETSSPSPKPHVPQKLELLCGSC